MEIQHTDRAPDRVDQTVDKVSIPMRNLSMHGKLLLRVKSLAADRASGVDKEGRSNMGEGHGDIEISKSRSRELTKRTNESARSSRDSAKDVRNTGANGRREVTRAGEPHKITAHRGNPTTITIPK